MSSKDYFARTDGLYRAFIKACEEGLDEPGAKGPTSVQLAGAMMTRKRYNEEGLPTVWGRFADKNPEFAALIRRGVSEMRLTRGEHPVEFRTHLRDEDSVMDKFITVANPDYVGGIAVKKDERGSWQLAPKASTQTGGGGEKKRKAEKEESANEENSTATRSRQVQTI